MLRYFRILPMLRLFRNALLVLATLVVLGAGALAVLAHVYEDEVKATLVSAINEQLSTPVSVSDMDLTLSLIHISEPTRPY